MQTRTDTRSATRQACCCWTVVYNDRPTGKILMELRPIICPLCLYALPQKGTQCTYSKPCSMSNADLGIKEGQM